MPTGQNGLFRLSGQGATQGQAAQGNTGAQSWTLGGASVDLAQRQQTLPANSARTLQLGDVAQVSASTHALSVAARTAGSIDASARAVNAAGVGSADAVVQQSGRTTAGGIAHVDGIAALNPSGSAQPGADLSPTLVERDARVVVTAPEGPASLPGPAPHDAPATVAIQASAPPSAVGAQAISRVQGLPDRSGVSQAHKYLIETNPVLTDMKQFMSSDYLLSGLGYNPDESAKRLGDGFYEQRLIQQAVVARTGQRFLDGQTTDEKLFKHLMDNAIASKQTLNLAVGVNLTSEQVAALTHDIVWLEKSVVNGEEVLVPVLYLANANNRLAPTGALIAGNDVSLIAGQDLNNVGTLRASNNLSAKAGNDLVNSGLIEAGNRLDLLAGNNIVNKAGGIIAGRDVTLTAVNGDVINERTVTRHDSSDGVSSEHREFLSSAARIEAANDLSIQAGRDVSNQGSVLDSGRDTTIQAGRDLSFGSVEQVNSNANTQTRSNSSSVTQNGSSVTAGRDLSAKAGRDLTAIASQMEAKRDVAMAAGGDLILASAADEQHAALNLKKVKAQEDHVSQVATSVKAGGDVVLSAGKDLALIASRVSAGDEAYLVAGGNLALLSAQDSDYSLYDMKKKGSWGSKETQRDEVTQVTNIGSQITSGGNQTLQSGGDQLYQGAKLESGGDIAIVSGGSVTFEAVKDLHQESHEKSKSDLAWNSAKGKGNTDETLRQTQMLAQGKVAIQAVDGLKIDIKKIDQHSVSETIDVMVKADPQLAWLKDAERRGDVDWRQVQEMHDSFKYSHSGLGQGAMLAIIIIVSVLTAGAASGPLGTAFAGVGSAGSGTAMAAAGSSAMVSAGTAAGTAAAGWGNVMATAALSSVASNSAVSFINNGGNIGATFKDITSSKSIRNYVTGALTAGFTAGVLDPAFGVTGDNVNKVTKGFNLSSASDIGKFAAYSGAQGAVQAGFGTALQGGSLGDNLKQSLVSQAQGVLRGVAFNAVGDFADHKKWDNASIEKTALHALVGGLLSEAAGEGFVTGAMAAGANEALSNRLSALVKGDKQLELAASQLVGLTAAAMVGGDLQTGIDIAKDATAYNRQLHPEEKRLLKEKAAQLTRDHVQQNQSGFSWEELLTLASDSQLDNSTARKYEALRAQLDSPTQRGNPQVELFYRAMEVAQAVVNQMSAQGTPLRWRDGSVVTAHGEAVLAFQATAEQKADSGLFGGNGAGSYGPTGGTLQADANRFGVKTALNRHPEISLFDGSSDVSDTIIEGVKYKAEISGLKDFTLLDVLPIGRAAAVGRKVATTVEAEFVEQASEAVLRGSATFVESKVIQANTTVQLSEAVTLKGGKILPKGSVVTVSDDAMKVVYPNGVSEVGSYSKAVSQPLLLPGAKEIPKELGKVSFDAANGVGTIYSPRVTMSGSEITFDEFAIGTSKGFIGVGADGAAELAGPLKKMLAYAQSQGAGKITLTGRYASPEGSKLGTGSFDNVNQNFSFSFPATKEGLRDFLKGVGQ